jgi:hypothetical protein
MLVHHTVSGENAQCQTPILQFPCQFPRFNPGVFHSRAGSPGAGCDREEVWAKIVEPNFSRTAPTSPRERNRSWNSALQTTSLSVEFHKPNPCHRIRSLQPKLNHHFYWKKTERPGISHSKAPKIRDFFTHPRDSHAFWHPVLTPKIRGNRGDFELKRK